MTQLELFKTKTKKEQILEFIKSKHYVKTHEVIEFGLSIFTNRGDRYARDLAKENHIKRIDDDEKVFRFGKIKESVYEFIK